MDKVSNKLASLKGRLLNKPGCVTLTNSVLTAIPAYSMQTQWLPRYVCDHLDKTVRSFIWKGSTNKGMHMVGWEKITKSKKNGGLGVRIVRKQNIALLGKLVWDMFKPSNHLWSQILSTRYLQGSNIFLTRNSKGSPIWNAIVKALKVLEDGLIIYYNMCSRCTNQDFFFGRPYFPKKLSNVPYFQNKYPICLTLQISLT